MPRKKISSGSATKEEREQPSAMPPRRDCLLEWHVQVQKAQREAQPQCIRRIEREFSQPHGKLLSRARKSKPIFISALTTRYSYNITSTKRNFSRPLNPGMVHAAEKTCFSIISATASSAQ